MAQLPPDSQRATWSHWPSPAPPAWPGSATPLQPRTTPVKATLATVTLDVVGLRCRPLTSACRPLCAGAAALIHANTLGASGYYIASVVIALPPRWVASRSG